jgi:hypothetical protein
MEGVFASLIMSNMEVLSITTKKELYTPFYKKIGIDLEINVVHKTKL